MDVYLYVFRCNEESDISAEFKSYLDELLDIYSLYLQTGIPAIKEEVVHKAYQLHLHDPNFSFVV